MLITTPGSTLLPSARTAWLCAPCRSSHARSFSAVRVSQRGKRRASSGRLQQIQQRRNLTQAVDAPGRNEKLPESPARTRFAPSPTGYLHIGGLRTALFSYLLARRTNGQFLLRIEDTDQKRLVPDAEERLCAELRWAGLQWDEGPEVGGPYGPYKQSERNQIYQEHARRLLDSGAAYRCFCTPQTADSNGAKAAYVTSGCYQDCSFLSSEESEDRADRSDPPDNFTVRLKTPADAHKRVYKDLIYGKIQRLKRSPGGSSTGGDDTGIEAADTILIKSDGTPTYHFANVVDDHLMKISHVIRGTEWMASTPLHYDIYAALGWKPPQFAHVGLLVDENKAKLSKRSSSGLVLDVRSMREQEHVLPAVLCNFLTLLGWSNPGRNDVLEMEDLIRDFDLKFTKGNTIVRMEKLWFLQKAHVSRICTGATSSPRYDAEVDSLVEKIMPFAAKLCQENLKAALFSPDTPAGEARLRVHCKRILLSDAKSYQTPAQYVARNLYLLLHDVGEARSQADTYDKQEKLTADDLRSLVREVVEDPLFGSAFIDSHLADEAKLKESSGLDPLRLPTARSLAVSIDNTAALLHRALNKAIWRRISPAADKILAEVMDKDDSTLCAQYVFQNMEASDTQASSMEAVLAEYKNWNAAAMRWMRDQLSNGQPGPGIGHVMALLGRTECEKRLA